MKDTRSVEQQVAALTEEQKKTILKVDLIGGLVIGIGGLIAFVLILISCIAMTDSSLSVGISEGLLISNFVIAAIFIVVDICAVAFIKSKFPYYSGKKCAYIKNEMKNK